MKRTIEKGRTLLVDGPASVTVNSGQVEVFGSTMGGTGRVVIREGKRLPFAVQETAVLDISMGENATVEEADGNTIPSSWTYAANKLVKLQAKPLTTVVLGGVDSGKTSFCTYLINKALFDKRKVAVLDGDVGQSDVGPPSTIAYAFVAKPITDLFYLQAKDAFFIGETSPSGVTDKMTSGLIELKKEAMHGNPDFLFVNTDGWVEGECAVNYKISLTEKLKPDVIFGIQQRDELAPLLNSLKNFEKTIVESPPSVKQRDKEERKGLRELGYKKYLRNPKVQSLSLSWLKVEGNESFDLNRTRMPGGQARKIYELLGMKPLHLSELEDRINIVIGRRRWIGSDGVRSVEEFTGKRVAVTRKGEEEGLLGALLNRERRFLGIGVVQEIDYLRKTVKICTPVSEEASILALGKIKLDKSMKEVPTTIEENTKDLSSFK